MTIPSIHIHTGPMGSGKTDNLIAEIETLEKQGLRAMAIQPASDLRSSSALLSRTGAVYPALQVPSLEHVAHAIPRADVVAFDEAHMWGRLDTAAFEVLCLALASAGRVVLVAGIDLGIHGRPIPPLARMTSPAWAGAHVTRVHRYSAQCSVHGLACQATHSWMLRDSETPVIGDLGTDYEAVCGAEFDARMRVRIGARQQAALDYLRVTA